jgi:hypothetical protein
VKREDDVQRRQEDATEAGMGGEMVAQGKVQPPHQVLMAKAGARRHVVDSVDDLVPQAVAFGELQEIVVRKPSVGMSSWCHRIAPVHASIVASS